MAVEKLTSKRVEAAKAGRHGDGGGLWLVVSTTGSKRWAYRFTIAGRVSEVGLGGYPVVSLAEARDRAAQARKHHKAGISPVEAKRAAKIEGTGSPSFGQIADELIAAKASEWRNEKHLAQWKMTLRTYCEPIRHLPVDQITTEHILEILTPLWQRTPETASRLRGRIEAVLDAAKAKGLRSGENPAAWRGHLSHLLPRRQKLTRGHHAAMPYVDLPAFVGNLRERDALAALALEFTILTAARSGETLGAQWSEIDTAAKVWAIPPHRMKAGKSHRVPLSGRAVEILETLEKIKINNFLFPGQAPDRPLSNMAMEMTLRRMKVEGVTVHGFRSAFRDWCGNETSFPREIAEAALAHVVGGVEGAYRRSDALEKRRLLMEAWARHCEPNNQENVVKFGRTV